MYKGERIKFFYLVCDHGVCVDVLYVGGSLVAGAMVMSSNPLPSLI